MNCLDCLDTDRLAVPAVAVCSQCGSAVCREHVVLSRRRLTRVEAMGRQQPVDPAARAARCQTCAAAVAAARPRPAPSLRLFRRRAVTAGAR